MNLPLPPPRARPPNKGPPYLESLLFSKRNDFFYYQNYVQLYGTPTIPRPPGGPRSWARVMAVIAYYCPDP